MSLKLPEHDSSEPECVECGRRLVEVEPDGTPPMRCEDCLPETGPGSQFADRLSINLRRLRLDAGLSAAELARRAAMHVNAVAGLEGDRAGDLRLTPALRLVHPLGASLDQLAERSYWTPGQIVLRSPQPPKERLSGFFLVLPGNVPVFEPAPPRQPVTKTREQAAAIFGTNVRSARERRHLTQNSLGLSAGLSKVGLSLIERGVRETSVQTLVDLARSLEVPPDLLLDGIAWKPEQSPGEGSRARHAGRSFDDPIRRLWSQGKTAREIAEVVGPPPEPSRPRFTGFGSGARRFAIAAGRREQYTSGRGSAVPPVRHGAPMRTRRSRGRASIPATAPPRRRSPLGLARTFCFAARKPA